MQRDKREDNQKSQRKLYKPLSLFLSPSLFSSLCSSSSPSVPISLLVYFPHHRQQLIFKYFAAIKLYNLPEQPIHLPGPLSSTQLSVARRSLPLPPFHHPPLSYSHTRQTYYFPLHSLFSIHLHSICGPMNLHCRKWRVKCVECGMWKVANPTQVSCCAPLADPLLPRPGARPGHLSGQLRIDPHLTLDLGLPFSRIARVAPNSFPHGPKRSLTLAI